MVKLNKENLTELLKDGVTIEVPQGKNKFGDGKDDLSLTGMLRNSINNSIQKANLDGSIERTKWKATKNVLPNQDQLDSAKVYINDENSTNIWVSPEKTEVSFTLSNDEILDVQFNYSFKIIPTANWNIKEYKTGKKVWIDMNEFKINNEGIIESVKLTNEQWSKNLWTGMMDARDNESALNWFKEANIGNILHLENANAVLTEKLKGISAEDLTNEAKKIEFDTNELKLILDEDILSYTNGEHLTRALITKGEVSFNDLTIFLVNNK